MIVTDSLQETIINLVAIALAEDLGSGDITSLATVPADRMACARLIAKADGMLSGLDVACTVFGTVDAKTDIRVIASEGHRVAKGEAVLELEGAARSLLAAERTALNFLAHLSGIATLTGRFVERVAGTGTQIIDTRKTTPGLRLLEKRAVRSGGGANHRIGLYDMILMKENHIRAAGGISAAVEACRAYIAANSVRGVKVEVETTCIDEVREALAAGCDRIMLDNMSLDEMRTAVACIRSVPQCPEIEASGNMVLERVRDVAETGVDFISIGALTHSAPVLDLSLLFDE
jgi:nicotinate-nucleotide pyrophosphorylase (carboxylating)